MDRTVDSCKWGGSTNIGLPLGRAIPPFDKFDTSLTTTELRTDPRGGDIAQTGRGHQVLQTQHTRSVLLFRIIRFGFAMFLAPSVPTIPRLNMQFLSTGTFISEVTFGRHMSMSPTNVACELIRSGSPCDGIETMGPGPTFLKHTT